MAKAKGAPDAPGMRGNRSRTEKGPLRNKRDDTNIGTIEEKYNIDTGFRRYYFGQQSPQLAFTVCNLFQT
jgi:hypothetical protein